MLHPWRMEAGKSLGGANQSRAVELGRSLEGADKGGSLRTVAVSGAYLPTRYDGYSRVRGGEGAVVDAGEGYHWGSG